MKNEMNYTYILLCEDGTYYTGWTNDLKKRFHDHVYGKGAKYTKSHKPVKVAYYETFDTPQEAMSREWHIKQLSRQEKKELMKGFRPGKGLRLKAEDEKE
jgi:predicted GIY-YIG superfamily endonuclease